MSKITNAQIAEDYFGVTNDFRLAGYLDVNGKLLDFSEGQKTRTLDHRAIDEIYDFLDDSEGGKPISLIRFMNEGNIRVQNEGIELSCMPNEVQRSVLIDFFDSRNGEVLIDFCKFDGNLSGCGVYRYGTSSRRILSDIENYFKTGIVPSGTDSYDCK